MRRAARHRRRAARRSARRASRAGARRRRACPARAAAHAAPRRRAAPRHGSARRSAVRPGARAQRADGLDAWKGACGAAPTPRSALLSHLCAFLSTGCSPRRGYVVVTRCACACLPGRRGVALQQRFRSGACPSRAAGTCAHAPGAQIAAALATEEVKVTDMQGDGRHVRRAFPLPRPSAATMRALRPRDSARPAMLPRCACFALVPCSCV